MHVDLPGIGISNVTPSEICFKEDGATIGSKEKKG